MLLLFFSKGHMENFVIEEEYFLKMVIFHF